MYIININKGRVMNNTIYPILHEEKSTVGPIASHSKIIKISQMWRHLTIGLYICNSLIYYKIVKEFSNPCEDNRAKMRGKG